ncbi:RelA/SpoT family protein [bacterium]|nr:bifunctional (p)ppGpp synthetase/guanosine-3',5'-bis(diphosphate) 3'-pyrophosphohydrolase [bacterium]MBU3956444.1 RelA/SpoT family protein [bacterium]MBU4134092.1 RelA/SpoT family protein [bacterium]
MIKKIEIETLLAQASDRDFVHLAFDWAEKHHSGQKRLDGSPYILHPYRVALELGKWKMDDTSLIAGLLHDLIEDTDVIQGDIDSEFGEEIASIVTALTKIKELPAISKDTENLRQLILAMGKDVRVIIIRLADKLDNMRTAEFLEPGHRERFARGVLEIYAPLAHRLGMNVVKTELENRAFAVLHSDEFKKIEERLRRLHPRASGVIKAVERDLAQKFHTSGVSDVIIQARVKSPLSIYRKVLKRSKKIDELEDIIAVRIITEDTADCYKVLALLHEIYIPVSGSFTDYISYPKLNMYQSIHTTCDVGGEIVEFQIRTAAMHRTSEYGIAAHWRYKDMSARAVAGLRNWLDSFYEWQMDKLSREEFVRNLKTELSYDEIFVLTPKGDVKRLIDGSSVIDFAYAVHSDIGDHFRGCLVNGVMQPMHYILKSGDRVEILTAKRAHPSHDWLKIAKSPSTRYKIRRRLRDK